MYDTAVYWEGQRQVARRVWSEGLRHLKGVVKGGEMTV